MNRKQIIDQIKSREREFRVWDKDRKKMIYGFTPDTYYNRVPSNILQCWIMMDFTGQLDANGKKIFEGDILCYGYDKRYWVVFFGHTEPIAGSYGWCVTDNYTRKTYPFSLMGTVVVIGNIFENPELMEAS